MSSYSRENLMVCMYRKFLNMLLTNFAIYAYLVSNDLVIFQGPYKCMNETNREIKKTNTKLYKIERENTTSILITRMRPIQIKQLGPVRYLHLNPGDDEATTCKIQQASLKRGRMTFFELQSSTGYAREQTFSQI